jgi:5-methylcytosine-specific restriction endonuclease McrA
MVGDGRSVMSALPPRQAPGGFCNPKALPKGPNGRNLCRRCSTEVPKGKQTFCSPLCIHEWKVRTQPAYARSKVWERDKGRCALCPAVCAKTAYEKTDAAWEMDHIIPVAEGGGSCGLDGLRTLCRSCHRTETAALRKRLAQKRAEEARP